MNDSVEPSSSPNPGVSRRTVVKGAAWAAPVIAVAAAAPVAAASIPPCIVGLTNDSQNWVVDNARYEEPGHTCRTYREHRDVRLRFHVAACDTPVTIQVRNVPGNSTWCGWNSVQLYLLKTIAANQAGDLVFPSTGDRPGTITNGYSAQSCDITAYESVNDGLHINPCAPNGPYFQYRVSYDYAGNVNTATWTQWFNWGNSTLVPPPPN